ncbi:hypothetical protein [Xanthobacter tagetidis]|uniref:Uncharacterized protein n=1 Tax=Xanthobacter tagetidis TaxID=60216 RepID=A0A3L7AGG0_9HYPH|nr:hypothetical protein [Xanthobacter tagetidis]MBB6306282.1 hypothetical protein [Xanthobacter tagetidis]RLP79556.1 hypothetical protein D9R14_07790 [Xanthobacter tagetidis]
MTPDTKPLALRVAIPPSGPCPWCGAYSSRSCEMEEEVGSCPWEDSEPDNCSTCGGSGVITKRVSVYEHGCGFPHDDGEEVPCPDCRAPDPDILRDDAHERERLRREFPDGE